MARRRRYSGRRGYPRSQRVSGRTCLHPGGFVQVETNALAPKNARRVDTWRQRPLNRRNVPTVVSSPSVTRPKPDLHAYRVNRGVRHQSATGTDCTRCPKNFVAIVAESRFDDVMARLKAFDEDRALDAAVDCFWLRGYEATSVRDLADAMGIGGTSLYNAYGDKRALFSRSLERYAQRSMRERIARMEASRRPKEAIRAF